MTGCFSDKDEKAREALVEDFIISRYQLDLKELSLNDFCSEPYEISVCSDTVLNKLPESQKAFSEDKGYEYDVQKIELKQIGSDEGSSFGSGENVTIYIYQYKLEITIKDENGKSVTNGNVTYNELHANYEIWVTESDNG